MAMNPMTAWSESLSSMFTLLKVVYVVCGNLVHAGVVRMLSMLSDVAIAGTFHFLVQRMECRVGSHYLWLSLFDLPTVVCGVLSAIGQDIRVDVWDRTKLNSYHLCRAQLSLKGSRCNSILVRRTKLRSLIWKRWGLQGLLAFKLTLHVKRMKSLLLTTSWKMAQRKTCSSILSQTEISQCVWPTAGTTCHPDGTE